VDPSNNEGQPFWPTIYNLGDHSISNGVGSYGYYAGCCVVSAGPSQAIGLGDDDANSDYCPLLPPVLAVYENVGRVVFSGDTTPLGPIYYPERLRDEEELLLQNIVNWLLGPPPNAAEAETWGSLKTKYR
jgi:hypothetical protein